jgi:hypothetical protein
MYNVHRIEQRKNRIAMEAVESDRNMHGTKEGERGKRTGKRVAIDLE